MRLFFWSNLLPPLLCLSLGWKDQNFWIKAPEQLQVSSLLIYGSFCLFDLRTSFPSSDRDHLNLETSKSTPAHQVKTEDEMTINDDQGLAYPMPDGEIAPHMPLV